jgi:uridine kinase
MELTAALFDLCSASDKPIIAIDGPAGAGKTTLAEHLSAALGLKYKCTTLHMDDLYNGWDSPFDQHLTKSLTIACTSHRNSESYSLPFFNWSSGTFKESVVIPSADLLILEGVGSTQSAIRPYLSASIWIDIEPAQGLSRVLARDGVGITEEMQNWLVQQEEHFLEHESKSAADFVLTTG